MKLKTKKTGRVRLSKIPDASSKSLIGLIGLVEKNIKKNTIIITDEWSGYSKLKNMDYIHKAEKATALVDDKDVLCIDKEHNKQDYKWSARSIPFFRKPSDESNVELNPLQYLCNLRKFICGFIGGTIFGG